MTLVTQSVMRERFYETAAELVDRHDRIAVVIAEIGGSLAANIDTVVDEMEALRKALEETEAAPTPGSSPPP